MSTVARWGIARWGATRWGASSTSSGSVSGGVGGSAGAPPGGPYIFVRNNDRQRVAQVDDYQRLELRIRFNKVGYWSLTVPANGLAAQELVFGAGIVVTRNATVLFSGPVGRLERQWNGQEDVLVASGPDDNCWLARRLTPPVPDGPPYSAQAYDVRTGPAETVMQAYVSVHASVGAVAARQVTGLTLAPNQGRGATVTGRARFGTLLEQLQSLALAAGDVGFRVLQAGTNLVFDYYVPLDRRASALFSRDLGNLRSYSYTIEAPEANYIYVAGGGEGTARVFVEGGDTTSITLYSRIEEFRDRRDTTDTGEMTQTRDEELLIKGPKTNLQIEPVDTAALQFQRDYNLGDRVTVVVDGAPIQDAVREVALLLRTDEGETVTPTIGSADTQGTDLVARLYSALGNARRRVSSLERR